jgi:perosamine synthetase
MSPRRAVAVPAPGLTYTLFDPGPCGFPPPRVPLLPVMRADALGRSGAGAAPYHVVGAGRPRRVYKRGRYALYDAYRLCGAGPGGAVLAPAYHCRTMLDPAISLGCPVLLYALDANLAPDLPALQRSVASSPVPVRALLLTHYFGFAQDAAPVRAFCDAQGIALIEDCSHALLSGGPRARLGEFGRYAITSPYKLLPCEEGGWLLPGPGGALLPDSGRASSWLHELKVLRGAVQRHRHGRLPAPAAETVAAALQQVRSHPAPAARSRTVPLPGPSPLYLATEQTDSGARAAGWLLSLCQVEQAASRRRAHFMRWQQALVGLPHARPLFTALPDDCVPYMFALLIDHPEVHFAPLKQLGMPIWRWDDMAVSDCAIAMHYSRHLLHLPCHQSLTESEMAWMIEAVTRVLTDIPAR